MHKKALTVAIAGALAAPMAAQAVDFTLSGQVSAAFSHVSNDATNPSTSSSGFGETSEAGNRFRMNGSSELATGGTVGIEFEIDAENAAGLSELRHANIQYEGGFGRVTLGQGSEAGDGSAGSGVGTGVFGIRGGAYKQPEGYFSTLNAGGRQDMIRYDTPAIGPIGAAVSAANVDGEDHLGTMITVKQEIGGTEFAGKLSTHNIGGSGGRSIIGVAVGAKLPAGLIITGAWAKAKDLPYGAKDARMMAVPETTGGDIRWLIKDPVGAAGNDWDPDQDNNQGLIEALTTTFGQRMDDPATTAVEADHAKPANIAELRARLAMTAGTHGALTAAELSELTELVRSNRCSRRDGPVANCEYLRVITPVQKTGRERLDLLPSVPAQMSDPSYFQAEIGYNFGDTTVAATWYQSQDFMGDGTDGTALGIGATHALGKTGAKVFAAARKYDADNAAGRSVVDQTVFLVGTVVEF